MGDLVKSFGGKVDGELIRARDWNGMLAAIEEAVTRVQRAVDEGLAPLAGLATRVSGLEGRIQALEGLADTLRARYRTVKLRTASNHVAIGQRCEITATVSSLDDTPLDLSNAASRPWVDFVATWGTLAPASGFVARSGASGRAVSVQVNASGQAKALIQADHAGGFDEAEHLEVQTMMATSVQLGGQQTSVAGAILAAATPASAKPAFHAITQLYESAGGGTMQSYLDTYYLQAPSSAAAQAGMVSSGTWTEYLATVLAFVKPDADPLSPDAAMAAGSIQVTFRDWVPSWVSDDLFGDVADLAKDLADVLPGEIHVDPLVTVENVLDKLDDRVKGKGVLGAQRVVTGAIAALDTMEVINPPQSLHETVKGIRDGLTAQLAASYGQAVTPGAGTETVTARAVATSSAKAAGESARLGAELTKQFETALGSAARDLRGQVKADQVAFQAQLLREDGPIALAKKEASEVRGALENVKSELGQKASVQFVTDFVRR